MQHANGRVRVTVSASGRKTRARDRLVHLCRSLLWEVGLAGEENLAAGEYEFRVIQSVDEREKKLSLYELISMRLFFPICSFR